MSTKHIIPVVYLLACLSSGASGRDTGPPLPLSQDSAAKQSAPSADDLPAAKSASPYLLEWYIDITEDPDLTRVWRTLRLKMPREGPGNCPDGCTAETFDIRTSDDGRARTVALMISVDGGARRHYFLFEAEKPDPTADEQWEVVGYLHSRGDRYGPPEHRIESGDNRTFFVTRGMFDRAEASALVETWYDVSERTPKLVLSYPVAGGKTLCDRRLAISFKSFLLRYGLVRESYTVLVHFLISYGAADCDNANRVQPLFAQTRKAYFQWDANNGQFVLESGRSEITQREIDAVSGSEAFSGRDFLENNLAELAMIARGGSREQKEWLKGFLTRTGESSSKSALQQALAQQNFD